MKSTRTYLPHIESCFTWHLTRIADEWSNKWSLLHFPRKYSEFLGANRPEISTKTSHVLVKPFVETCFQISNRLSVKTAGQWKHGLLWVLIAPWARQGRFDIWKQVKTKKPLFRLLVWAVWPRLKTELVSLPVGQRFGPCPRPTVELAKAIAALPRRMRPYEIVTLADMRRATE